MFRLIAKDRQELLTHHFFMKEARILPLQITVTGIAGDFHPDFPRREGAGAFAQTIMAITDSAPL